MQTEENSQRSWRIEVRAKAKNFNFKFKAKKIEPNWKIHRLSLLLKIRSFFIRVNSVSTDSTTRSRPTLIPKFLRIATKARSKPSINRKPETRFGLKRIQHCCYVVINYIRSSSSSSLEFIKARRRKFWLFVVASMVGLGCSMVDLSYCMKFGKRLYSSSKFVWNLWKYFV
ncbi:hypothetical protein CsatB_000224 [Cannabis sativa]